MPDEITYGDYDVPEMTIRPGKPADKAAVRAREKQAIEMRLAGESYDAIAEVMGYANGKSVCNLVMRALKRDVVVGAEEVRNEDLKRLDTILMKLWPTIMDKGPETWDFENMKPREIEVKFASWQGSIDRALKIMDRRAKYTGADAPTKVEVKEVSSEDELKNLLEAARHDYDQQRALEAQNAD